jgi:hypothetical protein
MKGLSFFCPACPGGLSCAAVARAQSAPRRTNPAISSDGGRSGVPEEQENCRD